MRLLIRLAVLLLISAGCNCVPQGGGGLKVTVILEQGLVSQCVKVSAFDGEETRETMAMPITAEKKQLVVAIVSNGLASPVTVRARGYLDTACTVAMETPGELSDPAQGAFTYPVSEVTLTLRPANSNGDGGVNPDGGNDAGVDAGLDAGFDDAGTDGGTDAGFDGGNDAGTDAGFDAGTDAGFDAGFDAGVDNDMDGFPLPIDCDDTRAAVNPNAVESSSAAGTCSNGLDDDCDLLTDCQEMGCANQPCAAGGVCVGTACMQLMETMCNDGIDNDLDMLVDCLDPQCLGLNCSDQNACTTGERCVADAGCEKTGDVMCTMPPSICFDAVGTCFSDGGANCSYTPNTASCDDGLACTTSDTCANGLCVSMAMTTCNTPPMCHDPSGTCVEPSGMCSYPLSAFGTGTCSDNDNCTISDTCDGDGGCIGTRVTCTPNQCQTANGCNSMGACQFNPRTGQSCDAGTGTAGSCDMNATCTMVPPPLFPFSTSNFTEGQLPAMATATMTVTCDVTINTSGTPAVQTNSCGVTTPPFVIITPTSGQSTVLFRLSAMTLTSGTLTLTGNRPAIFAVTGNLTIASGARILAANPNPPGDCGLGGAGGTQGSGSGRGGGGGGGFGLAGQVGGTSGGGGAGTAGIANGTDDLKPIRGGCTGGNGTFTGGNGGGSVQLTAAGTLLVGGIITAPGRGGPGGDTGGESGAGGGSGGAILLEALNLTLSSMSVLAANGGGGGEGGSLFQGENGANGTESASQAQGGADGNLFGGNGGNGGASSGAAAAGQNVGNDVGGGGGGGGVGRIRLNAAGLCTRAGVQSPAASTSGCP